MQKVFFKPLILLVIATFLVGGAIVSRFYTGPADPQDIAVDDTTPTQYPDSPATIGDNYEVRDNAVYWTFPYIREVPGADPKTFVVVSGPTAIYARDKSYLYVTGVRADGVDPNTFSTFSDSLYVRDSSAVYILEPVEVMTDYRYRLRTVVDADPKTIRPLSVLGQEFAADAKHLYRNGEVVSGIDGGTIETSRMPYVTDRSATYFFDYFFRESGPIFLAATSSISVYGTGLYARIGNAVFYGTTSVSRADPDTFRTLDIGDITSERCTSCPYAVDARTVFYAGVEIDSADPATFELVQGGLSFKEYGIWRQPDFAKDRSRVYYRGAQVIGADPATFVPVESGGYYHEYGKDDRAMYFKTRRIEGADQKTFRPVGRQQPYEGCADGRYGVDATGVYFESSRIPGADPATFNVVNGAYGAYGEDAKNFYINGEKGEKKDFKPCDYG